MTAIAAAWPKAGRSGGMPLWRLAWRNLWRNPRRTWLTSGGIGFAVSMQDGSFEIMIDNAARLLTGHVQLQHPAFRDDPRVEHRLGEADELAARIAEMPHVTEVLPRTSSFALASAGERSFGARVTGVEFRKEAVASSLPSMVSDGRYPTRPGEAFVGEILARNLDVSVGDELVMLGTALEGGVAATVAEVTGTFSTGQAELDRSILQIHIDDFREAWSLAGDDVHTLVILTDSVVASAAVADALRTAELGSVLDWRDLMPEAEQTIQLKRVSAQLFFALITVIVAFSVVNTFMMTVFERTPELGMLMAVGMRPGAIVGQLCLEARWLSLLGVALGLVVAAALVSVLAVTGMPLPGDAAEMLARYNMPDRMYPAFSTGAAAVSALVMIIGAQLAVLVPALRVRRLTPVQALRALE